MTFDGGISDGGTTRHGGEPLDAITSDVTACNDVASHAAGSSSLRARNHSEG
jgi:hypothetical protein